MIRSGLLGARLRFLQHRGDIAEQRLDAHRDLIQHQLAGLDLGQFQDGVDDVEQVTAGGFQFVQARRLARD
jgi:hypothetical protein